MASFTNGLSEIYVSPHIETLLGYSAEEWIDNPILWYQRLHPDDKQRWNQEFSRTVSWAEPFKADYRFLTKDNRVVWIHGEARVIRDTAGRPSFVQGVGYDITELKEAEVVLRRSREELERLVEARTTELEAANQSLLLAKDEADRANRAKSEFLSRMSHELRTPLNAILGFGQLIEMNVTSPEDIESTQQVLKSGHHLLELINEILDLASIEAGRFALTLGPVDAARIVRDIVVMVRPLAAKRQIRITTADCGHRVRVDSQRLKQVLLNLISNAIKYNREGGSVAIEFVPDGADHLRITITDTGAGMSPEDLRALFNPFERLNAAATGVEGTGLGLVVCKRLVEAMEGEIGVESRLGEGSTFWIRLPLAPRQASPEPIVEAAPRRPRAVVERSFSILYIEDNSSNARLLQRVLERQMRVKFFCADCGRAGVEMAREKLPDIILLDLYLPDISGEEVLRSLRQDEATASIPVLIVTADATIGQSERLLAGGAQAYLTKPLEIPALLAAIENALPLAIEPDAS